MSSEIVVAAMMIATGDTVEIRDGFAYGRRAEEYKRIASSDHTSLPNNLPVSEIHALSVAASEKYYGEPSPAESDTRRKEYIRDRVRFEDGYLVGWRAALEHTQQSKRAPNPEHDPVPLLVGAEPLRDRVAGYIAQRYDEKPVLKDFIDADVIIAAVEAERIVQANDDACPCTFADCEHCGRG